MAGFTSLEMIVVLVILGLTAGLVVAHGPHHSSAHDLHRAADRADHHRQRRTPMNLHQREHGFTVLEVLVAFVIAALALGVLYQGALGGLLATQVSGQTAEALARARAHLAVVGHGSALLPGTWEGSDGDGYEWRLLIRQTATAPIAHGDDVAVARGPRAALYAVTLWILWQQDGHPHQVRLDSERVASAPPPAS